MTRRVEEFFEYQVRDLELDADSAHDLQRVAEGKVFVGVGTLPGTYRIEATQFVGTVVLPRVEMLIRPKINPENLFLLLGVGVPSKAWQEHAFGYGVAKNLLAGFAAFFARTVERALAAGLARSYVEERSELVALRGRVDFKEAIRRPWQASPVPCAYEDYSADTPMNRVLKSALMRLRRLPGVPLEVRETLLRELTRFEEVSDDWVDPEIVNRLVFTRLTKHYEPAIHLARLILRNVTLLDRAGPEDASAFLIDMNELFQDFMTARLRKLLRGRLAVVDEPSKYLDVGHKVDMRPDLLFERRHEPVYVADLKYKTTASGWGKSGDYYQLLSYCISMALSEGALIYCRDGDAASREVIVSNSGTSLFTFPVDLSVPAVKVEAEVSALADWILRRSQGAAVSHSEDGH